MFLRLNGLVKAVRPTASRHETAGELINDNDFAFFDHVVNIAFEKIMATKGCGDVMNPFALEVIIKRRKFQKALASLYARLGENNRVVFFIHNIIKALPKIDVLVLGL